MIKKILVVDDETTFRDTIMDYLDDIGFQTAGASDGREALSEMNSFKPDMIMADLHMPVIDGYELIRKVRTINPDFPIIVISGVGSIDNALEAVSSGAWDFITKPITNMKILHQKIDTCGKRLKLIRENHNYQNKLESLVYEKTKNLEKEIMLRLERESELAEAHKKKKNYLDLVEVGIWELDTEGKVLLVNRKGAEILCAEPKDIVGLKWFEDICIKREREERKAKYKLVMHGMKDFSYNSASIIRDAEGNEHHLSWRFSLLRDEHSGEITGAIFSGIDITDQMIQQKHLEQAQKMVAMGEMLGAIAHQWRQPLHSLSMYISSLVPGHRHGKLTEEFVKELSSKASKQIQFMSNTIDDFRNYIRPSKEKALVEVRVLIERASGMVQPQLEYHDIELKTTFLCDCGVVCQVLTNDTVHVLINLINNAKDAINTRRLSEPDFKGVIQVNVSKDENYVHISVVDDGCGIPEDILFSIFTPYFSTKEDKLGTGIGLYLSKKIIEEGMNGRIECSSGNGKTVFTVSFPVHN